MADAFDSEVPWFAAGRHGVGVFNLSPLLQPRLDRVAVDAKRLGGVESAQRFSGCFFASHRIASYCSEVGFVFWCVFFFAFPLPRLCLVPSAVSSASAWKTHLTAGLPLNLLPSLSRCSSSPISPLLSFPRVPILRGLFQGANVYDIIKRPNLVLSQDAVSHLEGVLDPQ